MPFFSEHLPFFPFISDNYTGYSVLAGGIVLAIMISPLIISIIEEIIRIIPFEAREASLALGATKWQTIKHVVLKKALAGDYCCNNFRIIACFWRDNSSSYG